MLLKSNQNIFLKKVNCYFNYNEITHFWLPELQNCCKIAIQATKNGLFQPICFYSVYPVLVCNTASYGHSVIPYSVKFSRGLIFVDFVG